MNMRAAKAAFIFSVYVLLTSATAAAQASTAAAPAPAAASYSNPVIAGDFPDPSVIRVGDEYWATATSSEWAPHFPLLHSNDLINWQTTGAVFSTKPGWAESNFWAPEISEYKGRYYVVYTARRRGGPLCVASASADRPQGPFVDHGPLVCEDAGSIDGFLTVDENGQRYLLWKYDGNSRKEPTIIWAQPLAPDATKLIGEKKELIRNDVPWEGHVVEGPSILRRGDYFYMFYAGAACCGLECNYAAGVARSKNLLGPWEKNPANPIVKDSGEWRCPGHGTPVVDPSGRTYFMYHAYSRRGTVYVGREAVLDEVTWNANGWPEVKGAAVSMRAASPKNDQQANAALTVLDEFSSAALDPRWQWPLRNPPTMKSGNGLTLAPATNASDPLAAVIARASLSPDYTAETEVDVPRAGMAGLSTMGDAGNAIGIGVRAGQLVLWERRNNVLKPLSTASTAKAARVRLRVTAKNGYTVQFAFSKDAGKTWSNLGKEQNAMFLPPWDRSIRLALYTGGAEAPAHFSYFRMNAVR